MKTVCLFHWEPFELERRVRELEKVGYRVEPGDTNPEALRDMKKNPPAAVVIDLSRAPSRGRDVGIYVRHYKVMRCVPIIFVGGDPGKVAKIREHIPDAIYTRWGTIRRDLKRAIAHPPVAPVVPKSLLAGYSGTPLVRKLGIKQKSVVVLINAPLNVEEILVDLPDGVMIRKRLSKNNDVIIWFVKSQKELKNRMEEIASCVSKGGLWIAWPKQSSQLSSDLSQKSVRDAGLNAGLVDYKVCAIDSNSMLDSSITRCVQLTARGQD